MNRHRRVVVTDFIHSPLEPEERILRDLATVEALQATNEAELSRSCRRLPMRSWSTTNWPSRGRPSPV